MLSNSQEKQIIEIVNDSLDRAQMHWRRGGKELVEKSHIAMDEAVVNFSLENEQSDIPGHEWVQEDETVIDNFIALVADMRGSTNHLMCAISEKKADVSGLQRVYYETSALLPALSKTISFEGGSVTEYLGDGVLSLFQVDSEDQSKAIYASYNAAKNSVGCTRRIVNEILCERFRLPSIDIGVGLSMSKALVTLVGLEGKKHPKAFGECVFRATKLSSGTNEIVTDEMIQGCWPTSKGGQLRFLPKKFGDTKGFIVHRSS